MKYLLIKGAGENSYTEGANWNAICYCRGEDGNKHTLKFPHQPHFFSKEPVRHESVIKVIPNAKKDIFGEPVYDIILKTPGDTYQARSHSKLHYEADVHYPYRFRYDYKIKSCFTVENGLPVPCSNPGIKPKTMCIDIETMDYVDVEAAESPIVSIAAKDDEKGKYIIFIVTDKTIDKDKVQKIIDDHLSDYKDYKPIEFMILSFANENLMYLKFKSFLEKLQPDVLYGWYYTSFDHAYMKARAGKIINFNPFMEYDLAHAYKTLTENKLVSDKLDDVARQELKIGKLPRTTITEMLENDVERLVAYNLIDVYVTSEINKKRSVIEFHQILAEMAGTDLDGTKFNSNIVDSALFHFVEGKVALHSKGMLTSNKIEAGGRVHEASTGVRKNIAVVDLSRAYPTTIQVNNMSPETKLGYTCDICEYMNSCTELKKAKEETDVEEYNQYSIRQLSRECTKFVSHTPHYKMPSGRCYRSDKVGLIPATFMQLIKQRKTFQKSMKKALEAGNKEDEKKYFEMQRAVKFLMNSFYGVLGAISSDGRSKFRLADGDIGSDVTESIRLLNIWIEEYLGDVTKLEKYLVAGEDNKFDILREYSTKIIPIYGDTDSVLFEFPADNFVNKEDVIELLELLTTLLNRSFVDFAKELSGAPNEYEVEFEKMYEVFFQGGKKKRYAGLFAWKKGVWMTDRTFDERKDIKGFEIRRSDWSDFTRVHQKKLFEIILTSMDKKEVSLAIQDWKQKFFSGEFDSRMKKPKGITKSKYEKTMPMHVRAASYSNKHLGKDFKSPVKVFLCYMKKITYKDAPDYDVIALEIDENPSDYGIIDYDTMFIKEFKNPFARITDAIWGEDSWNELETGMFQSDMSEFF